MKERLLLSSAFFLFPAVASAQSGTCDQISPFNTEVIDVYLNGAFVDQHQQDATTEINGQLT